MGTRTKLSVKYFCFLGKTIQYSDFLAFFLLYLFVMVTSYCAEVHSYVCTSELQTTFLRQPSQYSSRTARWIR